MQHMHKIVIKMELKLMRHKMKQQDNYGEHVRCSLYTDGVHYSHTDFGVLNVFVEHFLGYRYLGISGNRG